MHQGFFGGVGEKKVESNANGIFIFHIRKNYALPPRCCVIKLKLHKVKLQFSAGCQLWSAAA